MDYYEFDNDTDTLSCTTSSGEFTEMEITLTELLTAIGYDVKYLDQYDETFVMGDDGFHIELDEIELTQEELQEVLR